MPPLARGGAETNVEAERFLIAALLREGSLV
jgi:hypothetical protein